jgi:Vitamin K-dependent gamma-carboxylase
MSFLSGSSPARCWDRFWFAPGSPRNLAAARIVFAATSLWVLVSRNFAGVSGLPAEFWSGVSASARWRYLDFGGHPSLERALEQSAAVALVCVIIGVLPRLSCFLAGMLLYHLAPLESIIWTNSPYARGLTISVLALLTLAFSPCGDCWTLLPSREPKQADSAGDYTWPVRLIQVFIVQIYFFSGYSKIFYAGWGWASPSNLRNWMLYFAEADQTRVFHSLGAWIAARPVICGVIGVGTLVFELGLFTVLFSRTARRLLVPLVAVFHVGILLSMNLVFLNVPQLLVFADWDGLEGWIRACLKSIETHLELTGPRYQA